MRRYRLATWIGLTFLFALIGCSRDDAVPGDGGIPTVAVYSTDGAATAPVVPDVVALPFAPPDTGAYAVRPLQDLWPDAATFLAARPGRATVGVVVPSRKTMYTFSPEIAVPMASVSKLVIMLAVMDRAEERGVPLTETEHALLVPMITESDNASASVLWDDLGGGPAVMAFLDRAGLDGIIPNPGESWGQSRATGPAVAMLMARLAWSDLLIPDHRAMALELLSSVADDQRWGVTAGTPLEPPEGSVIGVKDGWYPAGRGWWAASAGILQPGPTAPTAAVPYSIAVLTVQHPSLEEAVTTIEGVAGAVHQALHGTTVQP